VWPTLPRSLSGSSGALCSALTDGQLTAQHPGVIICILLLAASRELLECEVKSIVGFVPGCDMLLLPVGLVAAGTSLQGHLQQPVTQALLHLCALRPSLLASCLPW
jgi:hypothetical protein